jgi:hypothetical protein
MSQPRKLTKKEKRNGKRKLLIPSKETQEKMKPITLDEFSNLLKRTIPPSQPPDSATK